MPPKPRCSKEQIVTVAVQLIDKKGEKALTARELGKEMGCSSCPIFTAFKSMDELIKETERAVMKMFGEYVSDARNYSPTFKAVGIKMLQFAHEKPNLFKFLHMRGGKHSENISLMFDKLGEIRDVCLSAIEKDYLLETEKAKLLFEQVYVYCYGLAVLIATGKCEYELDRLCQMLGFQFVSTITYLKSNDTIADTPVPILITDADNGKKID